MQSQAIKVKKRGPARKWTTVLVCKSKEDADQWLTENKELWIYHYSSETFKYANQIFYCDHSKKNRPENFQCEAYMRIRYGKYLSAPSLASIQTTGVHDHKSLKDNGLSSPIKNSINEKDEPCRGMTARMIQQKLQTEPCVSGLQLPTIKQIHNQKAYNAKKSGFSSTLSLEDLQKYYDYHKEIPADEDQSFVVAFRHTVFIVQENEEARAVSKFIMVISTPKLLRRQVQWPVIQVDGTYKLMTLNYPLLVCGFSDADKRFFPAGAAIASKTASQKA